MYRGGDPGRTGGPAVIGVVFGGTFLRASPDGSMGASARASPRAMSGSEAGGSDVIEVRPAHDFGDMATMFAPKNPESSVCWCLSWRLPSKENRVLTGQARAEKVRELCARELAPGVLAHLDGEVAGWAGVAPRSDLHPFEHSRKIPHIDDLPVWSIWCLRVRPGFRKQGITAALIDGAVEYARACGAPAVESYPVDNGDQRVDLTMAFVGTRAMFERAGFTKAADTDSIAGGFPRILMRLPLA
jgi:GNAT superfamily N-acetyltransferase